MTVSDAYMASDLAPLLDRERVVTQYQSLTIYLNNMQSQSKPPYLQTFYASRLKEIEVANTPSENSQDSITQKYSFSYEEDFEEFDKHANVQSEVK